MQRQLNLTSRSNRLKGTYLLGTLALVSLCIGGAANVAQARPDVAHAGGEGRLDPFLNPVQSGPATPHSSAPGQAPAQTSTAQPLAAASLSTEQLPEEAQGYAQREAESKDLLKYRGGDAIVISASTLVIVLLVALLIVLLT